MKCKATNLVEKTFGLRLKQANEKYDIDSMLTDRYELLSLSGAIAEIEYLERKSRLNQLSANINLLKEDKNREINRINKTLEETSAQLLELIAKTKRFVVRAPITGYILDLKYQSPGQRITADEQIVSIVPDKDLIARVKVPSKLRAPIFVDMDATVEVDAFPSSDFGAITSYISSVAPTSTPSSSQEPQRTYMVDLKLINPESPDLLSLSDLRPGMSVTAKIKLRKKRIIATIFNVFTKLFDAVSDQR